MALNYPQIDPVFVSLGPIDIRWYAIAYVVGILLGVSYMKILAKKARMVKLDQGFVQDFIVAAVLGIIIGGRIGFILIYHPLYYLNNPIEIFTTWGRGMSFHGGLIGFFIAVIVICRRYKINFWLVLDLAACAAPIGIFLGRIANFINGELFGRITNHHVPWAMIFPNGGPFLRHPSQIYEALTEGLLLFIIMNLLFLLLKCYKKPMLLSGLFAIFYGVFRIFSECFRDPDSQIGYIFSHFTMGQLLSIVLIMAGIFVSSASIIRKN